MITLQSLGSLGEFVGAIGVVVSLVYLAQQEKGCQRRHDFPPDQGLIHPLAVAARRTARSRVVFDV